MKVVLGKMIFIRKRQMLLGKREKDNREKVGGTSIKRTDRGKNIMNGEFKIAPSAWMDSNEKKLLDSKQRKQTNANGILWKT
jgi:hypothetical protein